MSTELACKRGWHADLRFPAELAFDRQKRNAGGLPDDVASVDEEVDAGDE